MSPGGLIESVYKDEGERVDELKAGRPETPPRPNYFDPEDLVPMLKNNTVVNYHGNFNPTNSRVKILW